MLFPPPPFDASVADDSMMRSVGLDESPEPKAKARRFLHLLSQSAGGAAVRAVCVSLDRRPDRWQRFVENCPVPNVLRFPAVDGRRCKHPTWWTQGGGAWGCLLSHIRILEQALMDGLDRAGGVVLVFEDDALFPPDFAAKARVFLRAVPKGWEQLYLGGQHRGLRIRRPRPINRHVLQPFAVNRTQAYAVRGTFIRALYRHLCDWPAHANAPRHHVDHRMELLHMSGRHRVYCPRKWIVGQAGGKSDVCGRIGQDRFWNGFAISPPQLHKPPVWVIGLHRSGSSVTAGILHRLGVHVGNRLTGYENLGTGGFEAHDLATICEQAYPFPSVERVVDRSAVKQSLGCWLNARMTEAVHRGTIAGGKYPHLCFMVDMLLELKPGSRFIHIDRPIEESIRSLTDRSARGRPIATAEQCERLQRALWAAKVAGLAKVQPGRILTVQYHDLLADPGREVDRIIGFLHISVGPDQRNHAIKLVEPHRPQHCRCQKSAERSSKPLDTARD